MSKREDQPLPTADAPLDALESESVHIIREACAMLGRLAQLRSLDKDSNVKVRLYRKAFLGHVPFPRSMSAPGASSRRCTHSATAMRRRGTCGSSPPAAHGSSNVSVVDHVVSRAARARRNRHAGGVIWLTGLSGAGKSTLAIAAEDHLFRKGYQVYALDGDNVRQGLNATLGFSPEDRAENIRRVGEVAALFADAGFIVLTAFISPYRSDRERARAAVERSGAHGFHEVYVRAPLVVCEARDPKGLYRRARAGEIADFTGVSAPYEAPDAPELTVDTGDCPVKLSLQVLVDYVERHFALAGGAEPGG